MVTRNSCNFFIYLIICSNFHKYFNFKIHLHYWNKVPYATFIGVFAKGAGGAAAPPVLKKFGQNAINSGKITKFRAKILMAFLYFF